LSRIGIITGTRREAACLRTLAPSENFRIVCSGADAARARRQAEDLLSGGADGLVSFGLAGGIDPGLPSGTVILATSVISQDGRQGPVSESWRDAMAGDFQGAGLAFVSGSVLGVDQAVVDPEPKRLLHTGTGALCVDMESHVVMETARSRGVPCLVIRAVADTAEDELPDIAFDAIGNDGGVRGVALAARLLRNPREISDVIGLWRASRPAFAALSRVAALPSLCRPL
jgi:adenosylhomocysteine nucleosidase